VRLRLLFFLAACFVALPASAIEYQYGMVSIIESHVSIDKKNRRELVIRGDFHSGNDFYCKEEMDDLPTAKEELMWLACAAKLIKATPGASIERFPGNVVFYEPIILTLFGRQGWEVYHVEESVLDNKVIYATTRTFRVKRIASK